MQDTMTTLPSYCEQLKTELDLESDPAEQIIVLRQKNFSRETFKVLNKNLNVVFQIEIK